MANLGGGSAGTHQLRNFATTPVGLHNVSQVLSGSRTSLIHVGVLKVSLFMGYFLMPAPQECFPSCTHVFCAPRLFCVCRARAKHTHRRFLPLSAGRHVCVNFFVRLFVSRGVRVNFRFARAGFLASGVTPLVHLW